MDSKSDRVRLLVAAGDYKNALKISKDFRLGISPTDSDLMKRGYECIINPRFYKSIGFNPEIEVRRGVETVIRLYGT